MIRKLLFALLAFVIVAQGGDDLTARARVDSTDFLVGDFIHIRVELQHPVGTSVQMALNDSVDRFLVIDRGTLVTEGGATRTNVVVARYDSGQAIFPPIQFVCMVQGDTLPQQVATNPLVLNIHSVPVDLQAEIRDIKPPLSLSMTPGEILLYLLVALIIGLGGYALYRRFKNRKKAVVEAYVPPPKHAHVLALEQLALLKEKRLWQQGHVKQYYSEGTEIIRRYFELRFGFMALEQTTDEILNDLRRHSVGKPVVDQAETALRLADLVKFAKYQPGIQDHEQLLSVAYTIVNETKQHKVDSSPVREEVAGVGA